ncbi:hypothetical protein BKA82DRAFT_1004536 [Pisolithus tinctorius]|uniref:Cytochrome c oxidase assembly protein COX20, mitochondrial n=1 Tax=Pisolithus tinctorius Marx 270 TaxID=870435 RepID=A0A0C3NWL4_PISTI|nr:hypothetical protein BKA82DRAFT_1004536 [Pisolithus tinctorius]KIN99593.1 hypothetical protein M404DRAFT_1004536 [Pisolithus tinctorius Marx 270]
MSDDIATQPKPEDVSPPSNHSRRPIYKTETTGNYWQDVWEACKRISIVDDFQRLGEMPCARHSLLTGIASGAGVGVIRAISASPFVASNWAVGTFMVISLGSWTICQRNLQAERRRVARVVEEMPKRFIKSKETSTDNQRS